MICRGTARGYQLQLVARVDEGEPAVIVRVNLDNPLVASVAASFPTKTMEAAKRFVANADQAVFERAIEQMAPHLETVTLFTSQMNKRIEAKKEAPNDYSKHRRIQAPSGPARFPASLAAKMIRNKVNCTAMKVVVLVATSDKALRESVESHMQTMPDMTARQVAGSTAAVHQGVVDSRHGRYSCLSILADKQDDLAFAALRFAVPGEPIQVIAVHEGDLSTSSHYHTLLKGISTPSLQLEASL